MLKEARFPFLPTPRSLLLLLLAALFVGAAGLVPALFLLVVLVLATAVFLLVLDWRRTPRPADFELARHHHRKVPLRSEGIVEIVVHNRAAQGVAIQVRDEPPAEFAVRQRRQLLDTFVAGYGQVKLTYRFRPRRRGDHAFGSLNLRWTSTLGLYVRQAAYSVPGRVKVYPTLVEIHKYEWLARRGRLGQLGMRHTRLVGEGGEFEQLRDYVPDDDYRRISWKATAKYNKLMTMEYDPERSQNIIILVDTGRQMMSRPLGVARTTRLDLVINAVLLFSYVALARGDRVGILVFSKDIDHYLAPRQGRGQFSRIMEALYDAHAQPVDPDYGRALGYLHAQRQRRSLVVLLTDPTSQEAAQTLVSQLGAFYPHHLPLCVTLSDPTLLDYARRPPYSVSAIYERAVAEQILDERQLWLEQLQQRGVMTLDVPAHYLTAAVVNKYLEMKEHARI